MKKTIAVIGLGRFGFNLLEELSKLDVDVIAIDTREDVVNRAGSIVRNAFIGDSTNLTTLKEFGVGSADHVVIAIGQNDANTIVTSITTTIMLKKLGVNKISVRLDDNSYEDTFLAIGATSILYPSKVASERLAMRFAMDNIVDYFKVADEYNVFEVIAPETFKETNLIDLNAPKVFELNIMMIKRDGKLFTPGAQNFIKPNDHVFVFGKKSGVEKLANHLKK